MIPIYDLNGVNEEGASERKGISSGRDKLLLSPEEGSIERIYFLAFFDKGSDLIKCRAGYFESCFPHGPPYSDLFNPAIPAYISICIKISQLEEKILTEKRNNEKGLMGESVFCFAEGVSMREKKGGDLREERCIEERVMNA